MNVFKSKWLSVVVVVLIGWLFMSLFEVRDEARIVNEEVEVLKGRIAKLQEDNIVLERDLDDLDNPGFLEREVREQLNYKVVGEEVAFVYKDKEGDVIASGSKDNISEPFYKRWTRIILEYFEI
jgi:cell division protein FtsB